MTAWGVRRAKVMLMAETCPSCGTTLPEELGQHADDLVSARVTCPECGAAVTLREGPDDEAASGDYERAEAVPPAAPSRPTPSAARRR